MMITMKFYCFSLSEGVVTVNSYLIESVLELINPFYLQHQTRRLSKKLDTSFSVENVRII